MLEKPVCPACGSLSWKRLTERVYSAKATTGSEYVNRRLRILFEVWVPGQTEFVARFVMCRRCGFVCFVPRPTASEVDAKYRAITEKGGPSKPLGQTTNSGQHATRPLSELEARRSDEMFRLLSPFLGSRRDLLDFGGGRGALLSRFRQEKLECSVVDYTTGTIEGVAWLGKTLDDLAPEARFDTVLASHVFEHLADPIDTARQLRKVLRPNGLICIEVPLEVVGAPPKCAEPVTHINFFCPSSMRVLLERAGFEVLLCEQQTGLFASGKYRPAVRAVARVADRASKLRLPGSGEARALLGIRKRDQLAARAHRVGAQVQRVLRESPKIRAAKKLPKALKKKALRFARGRA